MSTDVSEFIRDLYAGVFEQKLSQALSDVAAGVVDHHEEGTITIKLKLKQIGLSNTVNIKHELVYKKPTMTGFAGETDNTETPMCVGVGGKITLFPEDQKQMFDARGEINQTERQS